MHVMTGGTAARTTVGPPSGMNEKHCIHVIGRTNQGGPYLRRQAAARSRQVRERGAHQLEPGGASLEVYQTHWR